MALAGNDGSIVLSTKVDTSGVNKGMSSIKNGVKGMSAGLAKLGAAIGVAFSIKALISFSNEASKMATNTEASVQRLIDIYGSASKAVGDFIDSNAHALGMSRASAAQFAAVYGNLFSVWADQKTNAQLTNRYLNATAVVASKTGRTMADVQERIRSGLLGNTEAVEDLGIFVNVKTIEMTEAFKRVADGRSWEQLNAYEQSQVRALAILEQSTNKYGNTVAQTNALTRAQYNAAFEDFKNTWGQVVNLVLMPVLRVATRILNTLTAGLRVLAGLSGKTIDNNKQFEEQTEHIGGAVDNQEALTEAIKDTAKEQKKLLAGFDDLEILSQEAASDASGGVVGSGTGNLGGIDTLTTDIDEAEYTSKLAMIGMVTGWALVGLGIIVMFSGHPLIGIGMVVSGYVLSAGASAGGAELGQEEKQKLAKIGTVVGVALIGLGVLLLFTKLHWKYGLAMIATGAMAVYSAYSLGEFSQDVKTLVSKILLISGMVAFTLGVILLLVNKAGMWKYGLGLMALGVAEVVTALSLGGKELKGELQSFVLKYWKELYAIGALMVVVGIVLLFVSAKATWKYALTLIVAGIAVVTTTTVLGGGELKTELQNFILKYWKQIYAISALIVIVGIVLLFLKQFKYGITCIVAGIATLVTATVLGGEPLKQELQAFTDKYWKELYAIGILMVVIGIALCFTPALGFGISLIISGIALVASATVLSFETIKTEVATVISEVKEWIDTNPLLATVLGILLLFVPGTFGIGIALLAGSVKSLWNTKSLDSSALSSKLTTELEKVNSSAKTGVNKINATLSGINSPTGGNLSATTFTLPALARGGIVPYATTALIGEAGKEAVLPLENHTEWMDVLADRIASRNGSGSQTVILEIDGREFGRAVVEQGNRENRRIGTRLVIA